MTVLYKGCEFELACEHRISSDELYSVLERATGASVHSYEQAMANGYINVTGGIRLGICGNAVIKDNMLCGIRELSSLSIRIPKERFDIAKTELDLMLSDGLNDILIASPPGAGKTSCLRNFVRLISDMGYRVSVADERGEIAAVSDGEAMFNVGRHTDVITGAPKAKAAMMLIRAMNPQVLAMDEISSDEDINALYEASGCGVKLIATLHARDKKDLYGRKNYRALMESGIFRYCLFIENRNGQRAYRVEEL